MLSTFAGRGYVWMWAASLCRFLFMVGRLLTTLALRRDFRDTSTERLYEYVLLNVANGEISEREGALD